MTASSTVVSNNTECFMFDKYPPVVLLDYIMNPDGVALILGIKGVQ